MNRWHANPAAQAALADLAQRPPEKRVSNYAFGESAVIYTDRLPDGTCRAGRPVRTLQRLYREYGEALGASCGDDFKRWALDSVDAAIDRAIEERAFRQEQAA